MICRHRADHLFFCILLIFCFSFQSFSVHPRGTDGFYPYKTETHVLSPSTWSGTRAPVLYHISMAVKDSREGKSVRRCRYPESGQAYRKQLIPHQLCKVPQSRPRFPAGSQSPPAVPDCTTIPGRALPPATEKPEFQTAVSDTACRME